MPRKLSLSQKGALFSVLLGAILLQGCGKSLEALQVAEKPASSSSIDDQDSADTQAPALSILAPQPNSYVRPPARFSGTCESGLPLVYSFGGTSEDFQGRCDNGQYSIELAASLADGIYSAWVSQTDAAGNKSLRSVQFSIDRVPPALTLQNPSGTLEASASVVLRGACEGTLPVQLSGPALSAAISAACVNSSYEGTALFTSMAGTWAIQATQADPAGNQGTASVNVILAASSVPAPQVSITAPPANALVNNRNLNIQGTCQTNLAVSVAGTGVSAPSSASCVNGGFQATIQLSAADGLKNVVVSQTNPQNQTGQASRSFQLDMTPPALAIQSPAAGFRAETSITLGGNCESGLSVIISGSGLLYPTSPLCNAGMFQSILYFSDGIGEKTVSVTQTDAAGNASSISRTFERIGVTAPDGWDLYTVNCSVCHRAITNSTKRGSSAAAITRAISNVDVMTGLRLTAAEIDAIAYALANPNR